MRRQQGLTLIEVLVYVSVLAMVSTVLILFTIRIIKVNNRTQLTITALNNARSAVATITKEIRHANGVYTPTSTLSSHPGQLSLSTTEELPTDENTTYVDFYLDDERLYIKRESQSPQLIISEQFKITNLVFTSVPGGEAHSIHITLTLVPAVLDNQTAQQNTVTISGSASTRVF